MQSLYANSKNSKKRFNSRKEKKNNNTANIHQRSNNNIKTISENTPKHNEKNLILSCDAPQTKNNNNFNSNSSELDNSSLHVIFISFEKRKKEKISSSLSLFE